MLQGEDVLSKRLFALLFTVPDDAHQARVRFPMHSLRPLPVRIEPCLQLGLFDPAAPNLVFALTEPPRILRRLLRLSLEPS